MLARSLLWRLLGLVALPLAVALAAWFESGGAGDALRGAVHSSSRSPRELTPAASPVDALTAPVGTVWRALPVAGVPLLRLALAAALASAMSLATSRTVARHRRTYVRRRVGVYRTDRAGVESLVAMYEALHKRLLQRWWRRLFLGQPSVALEVHVGPVAAAGPGAWLSVTCPRGLETVVEAALRGAYPNARLLTVGTELANAACLLRLKKRSRFITRVKVLERLEYEPPPVNRLVTVMAAARGPAAVQIALTPAPTLFERWARRRYRLHEKRLAHERREGSRNARRSQIDDSELRGGLDVQHRPLFFVELRVIGQDRQSCEQIASELRAEGAENRLVERGTAVRQGILRVYDRRVRRGEGNALPSFHRGVWASTELAAVWQVPSIDYVTVPFARLAVPRAPAPPAILRPGDGLGALADAIGPVSIHPALRRQNTAVPGTVEQGKSSYLVGTMAEDLRRDRCAIIVLDPKGDAASAALSLVPEWRTCTLLDLCRPCCGFNPLAVDAPADVIADYVVAALRNLFTDADIRASSDRYLRNAIIAVLAHDRRASLWDAARLLSVGEDGYAYRARVGARVRGLPEFKEISEFFTAELVAQLADARSMTTAKLDAPVNKLARLLNSASIKRVLLNDSLTIDFDRVIAEREVLVVKGALGAMGAGNTSVLMQLLVGMLDAALARQQDGVAPQERVAVALKIDEAPLVVNRGFAETMALKRSAGLETVACWQSDAQWADREVREQLDGLFAHRVYFATASVRDARAAASLMMAEFSDMVRSGDGSLSVLGRPDVRLHLPKHFAIASWTTPEGRQQPFVARTVPMRVDHTRLAFHAARQAERGGRYLSDLRQPHWDRGRDGHAPLAEVTAGTTDADLNRVATVGVTSAPTNDYRELVEMDGAHRVRWSRAVETPRVIAPEALDLEILTFLARLGHALTTQIHRRFNASRSATTTQRRLKRLCDAGWVRRFQFHRPDGGGVPMCYVVSPAGVELLVGRGLLTKPSPEAGRLVPPYGDGGSAVRQARHDVHVTGWVLAVERVLGNAAVGLRGGQEAVLSPPLRSAPDGKRALGPSDLRLPGGRTAHEFLRTSADGRRVEVEQFETVRPDAALEVRVATDGGHDGAPRHTDVLVELDDRLPVGRAAAKLERYDHFVSGWALHTSRYARRLGTTPFVVFVCRDRARARECARRADPLLTACRAYAGEYPAEWEYPGRGHIVFAAERDAHEGQLRVWGVQPLPPDVRASTGGDPAARACEPVTRELFSGVLAHQRS